MVGRCKTAEASSGIRKRKSTAAITPELWAGMYQTFFGGILPLVFGLSDMNTS